MKFFYSPETRLADTFPQIKEATAYLAEKVLGPKRGDTVSAEWTRVLTPREETHDRLTLRDELGEVFADFPPLDLDSAPLARFRVAHLWGDLIQVHLDNLDAQRWRRRFESDDTNGEAA